MLPSGLDFGSSGRSTPTQSPSLEFGTTQLGEMGRSSSARKESKYRCMNKLLINNNTILVILNLFHDIAVLITHIYRHGIFYVKRVAAP